MKHKICLVCFSESENPNVVNFLLVYFSLFKGHVLDFGHQKPKKDPKWHKRMNNVKEMVFEGKKLRDVLQEREGASSNKF